MGIGESKKFSALISNKTPEFKTLYNGQNFPLYTYENYSDENENNDNLFSSIKEREQVLKKENINTRFRKIL